MTAALPPDLAARDGEDVEVLGRYEASHLGRHQAIDPAGRPTAWLCRLELDVGGSLRLGGRDDGERAALLGRTVRARGRLVIATSPRPPHQAAMDPAPTLAGATVEPADELPLFDPVPIGLAGERRIVEVVVTHLQMRSNRSGALAPAPDRVRVIHARPPGVRFYRYLYDAVGAPWHWYDRKRRSDAALAAVVDHPQVEVHVAYRHGVPAGYVELDRRDPGQCEIVYFGLVPEAIGHGFGGWFLRWGIHQAWRDAALQRLWVHTCSLDHASALPVYQKLGFEPYAHERHRQYIAVPP